MSDAAKCGVRRRFYPIPNLGDVCYGFKQDYEQAASSFTNTPYNTVSPDDATAFLESESEPQDKGAATYRWTRTYYQVPPSWDDWENVNYTFPGFPGYANTGAGTPTPLGRYSFSPPNGVQCRVHYDYFMVAASGSYTSASAIPLASVVTYSSSANPSLFIDPPWVAPSAGITVGANTFLPTIPFQETYKSWVANAAASGWGSAASGSSQGQICIQSRIQRLAGNIWARISKYVLAQ